MHVLLTLCIYVFHCMLTLRIMSLIMPERPALHGHFQIRSFLSGSVLATSNPAAP